MIYHGQTKSYSPSQPADTNALAWSVVGLARSTDQGLTWTNTVPIISGSDPKPSTAPTSGDIRGAVEPGAILANGCIYTYYSFFPNPGSSASPSPTIQVARALAVTDGTPGAWTK